MSFYHRYELVRLVRNGEPKSFQAREIQTGRQVFLHLWGTGEADRRSPLLIRLRDMMKDSPHLLVGAVIEVQETSDPPYVVTMPVEDFPGLDRWLEMRLGGGGAPASAGLPPLAAEPAPAALRAPSAPPAPPAPPAGELARLFGAPDPSLLPQSAVPAAAPPKPQAPPAQPAGEFTRLFGAPDPSLLPQSAAPPAAPPPPQAPPAQPAGEFTRLFGAPTAEPPRAATPPLAAPHPPQPPPAAPVPPATQDNRDEFGRMFGPPVSQPSSAQAMPSAPPPRQDSSAGEFTRFFGGPFAAKPLPVEDIERGLAQAPAPPPSDRPFRGPSEFTVQFGPESGMGPARPPSVQPAPGSPPRGDATGLFSRDPGGSMGALPLGGPAAPAGPSEFTRVIQGAQPDQPGSGTISAPSPAPAVAPPPAWAPAQIQRKNNYSGVLVAVLSCLAILLVIVIVVLVFKK